MKFDPERVRQNARQSSTEDLLDRVTAYRDTLEPDAIAIIEGELQERKIGPMEIHAHRRLLERRILKNADGTAATCNFCRRPAVAERWGWHYLWRFLPIFPRRLRYCVDHDAQRHRRAH